MLVFSGSYTGTGSQQAIQPAGLTWQPDLVIVKGGSNLAHIRIAGMGTGSAPMSGSVTALNVQGIISLDAIGFTVGTDAVVNTNAATYWFIAIKDNGFKDFNVGTYTGNGGAGHTITLGSMTATPNMVITVPLDTANGLCFCTSDMTVGNSNLMNQAAAANQISALGAGNFQVGTSNQANQNTKLYAYAAFTNVTGLFSVFTYTGNGTSQSVGSVGFTPTNAFTKASSATSAAQVRLKPETGNNSTQFGATGEATNGITAFGSGTISVAASATVNANTVVYYAAAFADTALTSNSTAQQGLLMGVGP